MNKIITDDVRTVLNSPIPWKKFEGKWKNGKRFKGVKYNKYGKIIGKFENGEWIRKQ